MLAVEEAGGLAALLLSSSHPAVGCRLSQLAGFHCCYVAQKLRMCLKIFEDGSILDSASEMGAALSGLLLSRQWKQRSRFLDEYCQACTGSGLSAGPLTPVVLPRHCLPYCSSNAGTQIMSP